MSVHNAHVSPAKRAPWRNSQVLQSPLKRACLVQLFLKLLRFQGNNKYWQISFWFYLLIRHQSFKSPTFWEVINIYGAFKLNGGGIDSERFFFKYFVFDTEISRTYTRNAGNRKYNNDFVYYFPSFLSSPTPQYVLCTPYRDQNYFFVCSIGIYHN